MAAFLYRLEEGIVVRKVYFLIIVLEVLIYISYSFFSSMPHCLEIVIYYEVEVCTHLGDMHTLRIQSKIQFMYAGGLIILHIIKFNMVTPGADAEFGKGGYYILCQVKARPSLRRPGHEIIAFYTCAHELVLVQFQTKDCLFLK